MTTTTTTTTRSQTQALVVIGLVLALLLYYYFYVTNKQHPPLRQTEKMLLLSEMRRRTGVLLDYLRQHHAADPRTLALLKNYRGSISSTKKPDPDDIAYTINKTHLYICTHSPDPPGDVNNVEAATYVLLHELAHMATKELNHPAVFWENTQFLADAAQAAGVYQPIEDGTVFCGKALHP